MTMTGITAGELRAELEDFDDDVVVRVAQQPGYPLRAQITAITLLEPPALAEALDGVGDPQPVLWLATRELGRGADGESPYAPSEAWENVGGWELA